MRDYKMHFEVKSWYSDVALPKFRKNILLRRKKRYENPKKPLFFIPLTLFFPKLWRDNEIWTMDSCSAGKNT